MKDLIIKCGCTGKCGEVIVLDYADGEAEINGTFLSKKDVKKLIKYLQKLK